MDDFDRKIWTYVIAICFSCIPLLFAILMYVHQWILPMFEYNLDGLVVCERRISEMQSKIEPQIEILRTQINQLKPKEQKR